MIPKELIGAVIGPGGKSDSRNPERYWSHYCNRRKWTIRVKSTFSLRIKIKLNAALARIKAIVAQPEIGETYTGKVKNIQPFGAFVEFMPGKMVYFISLR